MLLRRLVGLGEAQLALLAQIAVELFEQPTGATTAVLTITGGTMASTATLAFTDVTGAPAAPPAGDGSGLVVTFAVDDAGLASVGASTLSGSDYTASIVETGVSGTYNVSATVANTSGAPLLDDDGTTAFIQPAAVAETVAAPSTQATTGVITLS